MAGLFGVGGSAAKTDRKQQLTSWGDLQQLFNFGSKTGKQQTTEGGSGLSDSLNYFKSLMSGNPTKMSQVLAPQISTIQGQAAQTRSTASAFGNRSGGTNATTQATENAATQSIQQLFELLGPDAAKEVATIGAGEEGLGQGLLNLAGNSEATVGGQASASRTQTDEPLQQSQQAAVMQGITTLLGL
jgi:hypothetical protein